MHSHHHTIRTTRTTRIDGIDGIDDIDGIEYCRCQCDCPEPAEATITLTTTQVANLVELLEEIDEFLRIGEHSIDALTEFYRTRHHDNHPRFAASCLIDAISFTALGPRRQAHAGTHPAPTGGADQ